MIRVPTHRQPTQPGEILVEEFVKPMGLTQRDLAQGIYVPYQRVKELVNRRCGLTPSTVLRLVKYFGTLPDFWMDLPLRREVYHTQQAEAHELRRIKMVKVVSSSRRKGALRASYMKSVAQNFPGVTMEGIQFVINDQGQKTWSW